MPASWCSVFVDFFSLSVTHGEVGQELREIKFAQLHSVHGCRQQFFGDQNDRLVAVECPTFVQNVETMFWRKKNRGPKPKAVQITDANFKEIVKQYDQPVLIDFWAPWCGPCKVMGPIIDELSGEFEGKAVVGKVNTEISQKLAMKYKIRSIPSLLIFDKGKLVERYAGIVPKPNLQEILKQYVKEEVAE